MVSAPSKPKEKKGKTETGTYEAGVAHVVVIIATAVTPVVLWDVNDAHVLPHVTRNGAPKGLRSTCKSVTSTLEVTARDAAHTLTTEDALEEGRTTLRTHLVLSSRTRQSSF